MAVNLVILILLAVNSLAQVQDHSQDNSNQCYQFVDLTQIYNLRGSAPEDYPRAGIAQEYGRRTELQEFLQNIMGTVAEKNDAPAINKVPFPAVQIPAHRVNLPPNQSPRPKISFDPKYIPTAYAGAAYQPKNPYQRRINPYQQMIPPYQTSRQNQFQHRVNIPGSFIDNPSQQKPLNNPGVQSVNPSYPQSQLPAYYPGMVHPNTARKNPQTPQLGGSIAPVVPQAGVQAPTTNTGPRKPFARTSGKLTYEQLRKLVAPYTAPQPGGFVAPVVPQAGAQTPTTNTGGYVAPVVPQAGAQTPTTNIGQRKPFVRTSNKLTYEQLRKLVAPYQNPSQRFAGYNPYNRTPRYQYGNGHVIRKRSNRFTYAQLRALVTPWSRPYPSYAGRFAYNNRRRFRPNRYRAYRRYNVGQTPRNKSVLKKPIVQRAGKLSFEQLRKLATPYHRATRRYPGYRPYNKTPRYQYGNGHVIRKRSNRFTYAQLQALVTPWNRPYPTYPGVVDYHRQSAYTPYRYGVHNGYNPYANNFNPYTARSFTNLRGRGTVGRFAAQGYQYGSPHYRHKRSYRVEPQTMKMAEPVGEVCPATMNDLRVVSAYSGNCWVIEPSLQMIKYATCGHDECENCKGSGNGVSKCTENYSWISIWAYCDNLPENNKIREIELYLPQSCSCKSYQC